VEASERAGYTPQQRVPAEEEEQELWAHIGTDVM
jgi:hypothetical protein